MANLDLARLKALAEQLNKHVIHVVDGADDEWIDHAVDAMREASQSLLSLIARLEQIEQWARPQIGDLFGKADAKAEVLHLLREEET